VAAKGKRRRARPSASEIAPRSADSSDADESLVVLSDVHLGSDIVEAEAAAWHPRRSRAVDRDLVALIEHYRTTPARGGRWRMVIAGDFVDFIGITLPPGEIELETEPSDEERAHGLGNAPDHARIKLRRVAERHRAIFAALGAFVADGHALTIVHGNHDIEFYWTTVQDEMREQLFGHAEARARESGESVDRSAFDGRIEFSPWFFYRQGVAWIEHGHQYDPLCATTLPMAPMSPLDPRRIARGLCDTLLRFVVRPTRGLLEYGHERMGIFDYLAFGARLGVGGLACLLGRFARAVLELFRLRRAYLTEAAETLRAEHERRLVLLAQATRIGIDRLRALAALQAPPVTASIRGILASVLLDRLALGLASSIALLVLAVLGMRRGEYLWGAVTVAIAWVFANRQLARGRKIDPADELVDRAGALARLFPAAFVVMGHTHQPVAVPVAGGAATYVNLGSWDEPEPEALDAAPAFRAPRTHLVIHPAGSKPVAEFLRWDPERGPERFRPARPEPTLVAPSPSAVDDSRA
jgi:UDP-2,3-diacylglucosamine pyrophosphatase LpxH